MGLFDRYSDIIVNSLLRVEEGESVSINTEEADFEFARIIASKVVEISKVSAKVVVTENGKPVDVIDFDPPVRGFEAKTISMLHLQHYDRKPNQDSDILEVLVDKDDLKTVQKLGHLADPVILNRRINIKWCTVPSYYPDDMRLEKLVNDFSDDIDSKILATNYRKQFLNSVDIDKMSFKGEHCDFTVEIPENSKFTGGSRFLSDGKEYISGIDFQNIVTNIDCFSIDGWFEAQCCLNGKNESVRMEYKEGKITAFGGSNALGKFVNYDEYSAYPGYISLNDKSFSIILGASLVNCLKDEPENTEDLYNGFNLSLYKLECRLDERLNISYFDCDSTERELVRKGFFLE